MKIAVVGSGISGMVAAWLLNGKHEVTLFEARDRVGGHTHTVDVELGGRTWGVDTGFIVFNERTYPNLIEIFRRLGVRSRPTSMGFSVRQDATGLEYSSQALLAQRQNVLRPRFLRMVRDILRFNREAERILARTGSHETLGDMLGRHGFSRDFVDLYIVPMGAAIWSTDPDRMLGFPARSFVRFLANHGLTSLRDRPTWRVVEGGSRAYVEKLLAPLAGKIRTGTPVRGVARDAAGVTLKLDDAEARFDAVVLASHSDQSLAMLEDASEAEREILGAIPYQENATLLHTDTSVLPRTRRAWSSWNYRIPRTRRDRVAVSYDMNILQGFEDAPEELIVSLGESAVDPAKVLRRLTWHHPLFTPEAMAAQKRKGEISGVRNTWYAGAYWRYGFHEDGVMSALDVTKQLGCPL